MNILLDLFLLLLFLLIVIIGTERGFVDSVWSTVTIVGAFILAYMFGGVAGDWICQNFVLNRVSEYAYEIVQQLVQSNAGNYDISALFDSLPDEFVILVENCGADLSALELEFGSAVTLSETEFLAFAESLALPISKTLSYAIATVLIFVISILILWLLGLLVKIIVKIPIIKSLNSFLGFLFGALKGFIILWIVCVALSIFVEKGFMNPESAAILNNLTSSSYVFKFFCTFSPINFINIG